MGPVGQMFNQVDELFVQCQQETNIPKVFEINQRVVSVFQEIMSIYLQNPGNTEIASKLYEKMDNWHVIFDEKKHLSNG